MTKQNIEMLGDLETFEDRLEIVIRELDLAVKWLRPCVLLIIYSSESIRTDVETALGNYLINLGQKTASFRIENQNNNEIIRFMSDLEDSDSTVFFIDGLRWGMGKDASIYTAINLQKEFIFDRKIRAIFWVTQSEIVDLAHYAPDFWAHRNCAIEFSNHPKAEQILEKELESAWQGVEEYASQFKDINAISFHEALLTKLPEDEEKISNTAHSLLTLGILNWRKGDYEKANEQLQDALRIAARIQDNWFEAECLNAIALVKTSLDRFDEAINTYKQAICLAPEKIFVWNNLGNLCAKINRNDEAIVAFQKSVECNPKDSIAWNGLGNVYYKIRYFDNAIVAYRKSILFMPTLAYPWNGLGDVYATIGKFDDAMKAYLKAIELNEEYITPWLGLGNLFAKLERYRDAIRTYQRALKLDRKNSVLWNELGMIYLKNQMTGEAVDAFSTAIELDQEYGWAYSNLALAYTQQGRFKESVILYVKAIELFNENKDKAISWNRLANLYRQLNEYSDAISAYRMADRLDSGTSTQKNTTNELENGLYPEERITFLKSDTQEPVNTLANRQETTIGKLIDEQKDLQSPETTTSKTADAPYWIFNPTPNNNVNKFSAQEVEHSLKSEEKKYQTFNPDKNNRTLKGVAMQKSLTLTTPSINTHWGSMTHKNIDGGVDEIKAESTNAYVWNEKGNVHFKQGDLDKAINAYNKAIQLSPSFGWPYSNLALAYLAKGQYPEAILLYQKSIELLNSNREKALSWNGLGNVYRLKNDYTNAVVAYQKAAELDPDTAGMRDAADNFQIVEGFKSAQDWNDLGELLFKTEAYDDAVKAFNKALELEPTSCMVYSNMGRALVAKGQYKESIIFYQKNIDLLQDDKDKANAWNRLGNVYRKLNDYDNAIKAYQKAVLLADEGDSLLTRTRFSLLSNCYINQ